MRLRYRLALGATCATILVASALHTSFSDRFVKRRVQDLIAASVRAPCHLESATFSFLEGLEVRGLVVLDPTDPLGPAVLRVERATLDYTFDVFGTGPRITEITLEEPVLRVTRRLDGRLSLASLLTAADPDADAPQRLPKVTLERGRVFYTDPGVFVDDEPVELEIAGAWITPPADGDLARVLAQASNDLLGKVAVEAHLDLSQNLQWTDASIRLQGVGLGAALAERLGGDAGEVLRGLRPRGNASVTASVERDADGRPDLSAEVILEGVGFEFVLPDEEGAPECAPIAVSELAATVRVHGGRAEAQGLSLQMLGATFSVDAAVSTLPGDPAGRTLDATVRVKGLDVSPALGAHLPRAIEAIRAAYSLDLRADVTATLTGPLESPDVLVVADVAGGSASYAGYVWDDGVQYGFPWRLDEVRGRVTVDGPLITVDAAGVHGAAQVQVKGTTESIRPRVSRTDIRITATDVPLDSDLRAGFGDRAEEKFDRWGASGVVARTLVHVESEPVVNDGASETHVTLEFDGRAVFRPHELPTPFTVLSGIVEVLRPVVDGERVDVVTLHDLRALSTDQTFSLRVDGSVRGVGTDAVEALDVFGTTTDLGGTLREGLLASNRVPPEVKETLVEVEPAGPAAFGVELRGDATGRADAVRIEMHGTSVQRVAGMSLPFEDLHGDVIVEGDMIRLRKVHGVALGVPVRVEGSVASEGGHLSLDIEADGLGLGQRLRGALGPLGEPAAPFFDEMRPDDDTRGDVRLRLRPPGSGEREVTVRLENLSGGVRPLGLPLHLRSGRATFDGKTMKADLEGTLGTGDVTIDQCVVDAETGAVVLRATARDLAFPDDLAGLLSDETIEAVRKVAPSRRLHLPELWVQYEPTESRVTLDGPVTFRPRTRDPDATRGLGLEGDLELVGLELWPSDAGDTVFRGRIEATDVRFDVGIPIEDFCATATVEGVLTDDGAVLYRRPVERASFRALDREFKDASFLLELLPGSHLKVVGFEAAFYGGTIRGDVGAGSKELAYRGEFVIEGADAGSVIGAPPEDKVGGSLDAQIAFRNRSGLADGLQGSGDVRITRARLAQLPVVHVITNQVSDESKLQSGTANFDLAGRRVRLSDIRVQFLGLDQVFGNVPDGEVWVGFDGRVDGYVDVYALSLVGGIPLIGEVVGQLQRAFYRMRISGTLRNPRVSTELLPPLRGIFGGDDPTAEPEPLPAGDLIPADGFPW